MAAHKPLSHLMWEGQTTNSGVHQKRYATVPSLQHQVLKGNFRHVSLNIQCYHAQPYAYKYTHSHHMPLERSTQKEF